ERVAVHARQLAFEPDLQIIRRSRRPLLRGLEQARRSAVAHHVYRIASMGARVLINGTRYYWCSARSWPYERPPQRYAHGRCGQRSQRRTSHLATKRSVSLCFRSKSNNPCVLVLITNVTCT